MHGARSERMLVKGPITPPFYGPSGAVEGLRAEDVLDGAESQGSSQSSR